jgi:outer membrane receptor protein involved in Fe transport
MAMVGARKLGFRAALMAGATLSLLCATPALAQQKQHFDLAAGDAAQRARAVATQSGTQVIATNADLAGVRAKAVRGDYSPAEALTLMLEGTGLQVSSNNGVLAITRAAAASQADPASDATLASDEEREQSLIVTGTRIKRTGVDTIQAATVTDSAEFERRGYTNAIQALQDTPGFGAPGNSQLQSSQGNLGIAQSFSNFFGLGSQRTLTLVNGRRFVSSNTVSGTGAAAAPGSQVDLNLMPVGLIDRIETVAIGGAPVYGSDAIAGTVNVILKEDYDGLQLTGLTSISDRGDAANQTVRGLFGKNFAGGRGNIVLGAEYVRQEGMKLNNRFPAFLSLVSSGDTDRTNGIPALTVIDQRIALLTEGGLPFRSGTLPAETTYITANGVTADKGGQPLMFGNGGLLVPYVRGARFTGDSGGLFRNGGDGLNPADHALLLSPNERYLLNALGNFDVTPGINLFFEGSYAHTSGTKLSDLFQFAAPGVGGPSLAIRADNAFLPQQTRDILAANGITGATTFRLNRNLNDIADSRPARTELDVWRVVVGAKGRFGVGSQEWNWDLSYNYGHSRNRSEFNQINQTRFLSAIDAVSNGGTIQCRSGGSCIPLNIFGTNQFSQEAADAVIDQGIGISTNSLSEAEANLGGSLPFGIAEPIRFSLGYAHRREAGSFAANDILNGGLTLLGGALAFPDAPTGSFNTDEAYLETVIPIVDDEMNLPLIKRIEFEGAARYVSHSTAGGDVTWSAGGRLQPRIGGIFDGLTFRGVFTHAIRSPSIVELFLNSTPVARAPNDVCASTRVNTGPNPTVRAANCTAALAAVGAGSPSSFTPTTNGASPFGTVGGNPNLDNEQANSWSLGMVYQPPAIPRLRMSLDYSHIRVKGAISRFTLGTAQTACYDSPAYPNEGACDAFHRLTVAEAAAQSAATGRARIAGDIADGYLESYFNSANIDFGGFIGEIDYRIPVDNIFGGANPGSIRLGLKAFHIDHYRTQSSGAAPVIESVGTVGTPRWRLNGRIGLAFDPVDWDIQVIYNSRQVADRSATIEDTPVNDYGTYTTVNSSLGFKVGEKFRLQFSVRNLLDRKIPYSASVTRVFGVFDPIGRSYTASATIDF